MAEPELLDLAGWWESHEELEQLIRSLLESLEAKDPAGAQASFDPMQEIIAQHLEVEERTIFPRIEHDEMEHAQAIKSLRLAHIEIRSDLRRIGTQLGAGHLDAARSMLTAFLQSFGAHERLEDQLAQVLKRRAS